MSTSRSLCLEKSLSFSIVSSLNLLSLSSPSYSRQSSLWMNLLFFFIFFCFLCSFIAQLELQRRCLQIARELCKETSQLRLQHLQRDYVGLASRLQELPSALMTFHEIYALLCLPGKREKTQAYGGDLEMEALLTSRRTSSRGCLVREKGDGTERKDGGGREEEEQEFEVEDSTHSMEDLIAAEQKGMASSELSLLLFFSSCVCFPVFVGVFVSSAIHTHTHLYTTDTYRLRDIHTCIT